MTDELAKAAERLRRTKAGEQVSSVYAHPRGELASRGQRVANATVQQTKDRRTVADFALPLLDGTPLDEAWLRSVGFAHVQGGPPQYSHIGCLRTMPEFTDREGERVWEVIEDFGFNTIRGKLRPKTRGAVRMLAAALGIELKEPEGRK